MTDTQMAIRQSEIRKFWRVLIPAMTPPDDAQTALWITLYQPVCIRRGIARAAAKARTASASGTPMDNTTIARYASGVMANESRERRAEA